MLCSSPSNSLIMSSATVTLNEAFQWDFSFCLPNFSVYNFCLKFSPSYSHILLSLIVSRSVSWFLWILVTFLSKVLLRDYINCWYSLDLQNYHHHSLSILRFCVAFLLWSLQCGQVFMSCIVAYWLEEMYGQRMKPTRISEHTDLGWKWCFKVTKRIYPTAG